MADTNLIERLNVHAASWRRDDAFDARDPEAEAAIAEEAATALSERDKRIAELEAELEAARFAERNGQTLAEDSIHAIRELLKAHDVPVAAFIDDHVGNAIAQRDEARAECEGLRAAISWIRGIADANLEQDEKLRSRGARTLKRIADRCDTALSQKETGDAA